MQILWTITICYLCCLGALGLWGIHRMLLLAWLRHPDPTPSGASLDSHAVLIQLPLFNEAGVARRLIDAVASIRWPNLRIQVLDDSTDHTSQIVQERVRHWAQEGVEISHIQRHERVGYKAGALAHGLTIDSAEFIAVFDADFVPPPDFLIQAMPGFHAPDIGMVQARWGHINRDQNWLTRVQAMLLDGHFIIEHAARYRSGRFFNFNGTAGIWRRSTIVNAGGWAHDTVTEDLDLSYRAQLAGWSFVYLDWLVAPAEIPGTMRSFLSQQHRWAKGTAQTARKLCRTIATAPLPARVRLEAITHLTMVFAYPAVLLLSVLLPPSVAARAQLGAAMLPWADAIAVVATTVTIACFYAIALKRGGEGILKRWWEIPLAMSVGIGCSGSQTLAVLAGLFSNDATFVRTPKQGDSTAALRVPTVHPARVLLTGAMTLYYCAAIVWAGIAGHWIAMPIMVLFGAGFAISFTCLIAEGQRIVEAVEMDHPQPAK